MASRSESAAQSPRSSREAGRPRNVLATIASAMFFGGCLVICGSCAGSLYFFRPQVREDPSAVAPVLAEMLDISVPAAFEPRGVIEWNMVLAMSLRGAYYEMPDPEAEGTLAFLEVHSRWDDDPDVQAHIEQALREKGGGVRELELVGNAQRQPVLVRGEAVDFTFETRRDPATDVTYRIIEGVVDGKTGPVWIGVRVREAWTDDDEEFEWDDDTAIQMIESIR